MANWLPIHYRKPYGLRPHRTPPQEATSGALPVGLRCGYAVRALVLAVGLEHEITETFLCCGVSDVTQQCETASIAIHRVLARRERDVAATAAATLPDCKPDN